jgi:hypothetical protein
MNKIAIVHLYCNGFSDEDLLDFKLMLSNPSTIAQQQKLELFKSRFEAAGTCLTTPGLVDRGWVQKNILRLTDDELKAVKVGLKKDKLSDLEIESTQLTPLAGPENPGAEMPQFGGGEAGGGGESPLAGIDLGGPGLSETNKPKSIDDDEYPIRVQKIIELSTKLNEDEESSESEEDDRVGKVSYNNTGTNNSLNVRERDKLGSDGLLRNAYDLKKSYSMKSQVPSAKDIALEEDFDLSEYLDTQISFNTNMDNRLKSTLNRLGEKYGDEINRAVKSVIISESNNSSGEEDDET